MRLQRLFLILSLLLSIAVLSVTVVRFQDAWQDWQQASSGYEAMQELQALLVATEMASRERGPTNGILGDTWPSDPRKQQRLRDARTKTDAAFARLNELVEDDAAPARPAVQQALRSASVHLQEARQTVDRIAQKKSSTRSADEIHGAIVQMFRVVEDLVPGVIALGNEAQSSFPKTSDILLAARLASSLREYAGQLGSQFTVPLTKRQPLTTQEHVDIERLRGRIDQLVEQLMVRTSAIGDRPPVQAAMVTMHTRYFKSGLGFVESQIAIGLRDGQYEVDTAEFAARYVPDMDSIVAVREVLMEEAFAQAQRGLQTIRTAALWSAAGGLSVVLLLAVTLWLLQSRVFRRLEQTTALIDALAQGDLDYPLPPSRYNDELAEVMKALTVLRDNSQARLALEAERERLMECLAGRNRYLALNNRVLQKLSDGTSLHQLLDELLLAIEAEHPGAVCTVLLATEDGSMLQHAAAPSMPTSWIRAMQELQVAEGMGCCGTAAYRKERVVVEDLQTHPFWQSLRSQAQEAGLKFCSSQPLMDAHAKVVGTFAIYHAAPVLPDESQDQLIEDYAKLVAFAIERARLADALRESQALYQLITEYSQDNIWVRELPSLKLLYCSPSVTRLLGWAHDEILSGRAKTVSPEQRAQAEKEFKPLYERILAGDHSKLDLAYEIEMIHKDGRRIPMEMAARILLDRAGQPIKIVGATRDISERKAASKQLVEQQNAMQSLLEYSPVGMAFSTQGVFRYTNSEFEKMFDLRSGDLAETIYVHPADRVAIVEAVQRDGIVRGHEMQMRCADGVIRDFLATFIPLVRNGQEGLMGWLMDITERKATEKTIRKMAFYDQLTGLPNRRLLEDRMQQLIAFAQREGRKMAVLFMDLDKFKQVNDLHGHEAGDWLLVQVASRLKAALRQSDTAARVGGDEFVILLPDAHTVKAAVLIAEKIRQALEQPFIRADGVVFNISSSIGVAMYPKQADNAADLLRLGDEAMYMAKRSGRNAVEVLTATVSTEADSH